MSEQPAIVIDQKKYRIRIYKRTLHMLGDPKFIQFLINPKDMAIVIRGADRFDSMAHRIVLQNFISKQCFEIGCKYLILKIQHECTHWNIRGSYRIFGEMLSAESIARFDLQSAAPCSNEWEE
jgi:hypothetical protein